MSQSNSDRSHENKFGFLRLFFAYCVLVSHSIELIDGNRSREPLTRLFGTISLGELGVDGFFLISGFLILQSFSTSRSYLSFLWKRILRIYPAFLVAFALCILVVGPLAGGDLSSLAGLGWAKQIAHALLLEVPWLPNTFTGLPYPALDGAMWTIPYEFRCYLIIAAMGVIFVRRRIVALVLAVLLLLASALAPIRPDLSVPLLGTLKDGVHLTTFFLFGSLFYLYRNSIPYRAWIAIIAAALTLVSTFSRIGADLVLPVCGGYVLFWFSFAPIANYLNAVGRSVDLSYGIYLYAWPVQNLLIFHVPGIGPASVIGLTTILSAIIACGSWFLIEDPALAMKHRRPSIMAGWQSRPAGTLHVATDPNDE